MAWPSLVVRHICSDNYAALTLNCKTHPQSILACHCVNMPRLWCTRLGDIEEKVLGLLAVGVRGIGSSMPALRCILLFGWTGRTRVRVRIRAGFVYGARHVLCGSKGARGSALCRGWRVCLLCLRGVAARTCQIVPSAPAQLLRRRRRWRPQLLRIVLRRSSVQWLLRRPARKVRVPAGD